MATHVKAGYLIYGGTLCRGALGWGGPLSHWVIVGRGFPIYPPARDPGVGFKIGVGFATETDVDSQIETPPPPGQSPQAGQTQDLQRARPTPWANDPLDQGIADGGWGHRGRLSL